MVNKILNLAQQNKKRFSVAFAATAGVAILVGQLSGPVNNIDAKVSASNQGDVGVYTNQPVQNDYLSGVIKNYVEVTGRLVSGYELCIDGQPKIVVGSKEDLESVLELVQQRAIGQKAGTEVLVTKNEEGLEFETSIIPKPQLQLQSNEIGLSTSANGMNAISSINKSQTSLKQKMTFDTGSGNIVNAVESNEKVNNVEFGEEIQISKVEVNRDDIISVEEAVAILNSTNIAPTTYTVLQGDSPYQIALDNDMKLEDLYVLNSELETNVKGLQVGDEVIVMVPEPELSVVVEETLIYYDLIPKEYVYIDDDTIYETVEEVSEPGLDGTSEITAIIKVQEGKEISREVISEKVITEQVPQVIRVGTKPLPYVGPTGTFKYPLSNFRITSYFGKRWGGFHTGVDLAVNVGTIVSASDGGTVTKAGWSGGYGYMIEIDHGNGMTSRYAHNSSVLVKVGQVVGQHEAISRSGSTGNSTGPHLHFEILVNGKAVNPLDYIN